MSNYEVDMGCLLNCHGIKYFKALELAPIGRNGLKAPPINLLHNIIPTVKFAEWLRIQIGYPLYINSGYRDPEYNKKVGGAPESMHVKFNALDIHCRNMSAAALYSIIVKTPEARSMGVGLYANFVHIDTRGLFGMKAPARW